jgi:uncharacterized membrane protein
LPAATIGHKPSLPWRPKILLPGFNQPPHRKPHHKPSDPPTPPWIVPYSHVNSARISLTGKNPWLCACDLSRISLIESSGLQIVLQSAYNSFWEGFFVPQDRTRKIVVAGVLSAITIILGITKWGLIPWFSGFSLTILHVPVIIGAILEGPIVGFVIGLIFGASTLLMAAIAPNVLGDPLFTNPLISVLPRLFIGPIAWLVWTTLRRIPVLGLVLAGIAGSLTNTILVLSMILLFINVVTWEMALTAFVVNGLPEAAASAIITLVVVSAYLQIRRGKKQGADL